MNSPESPLKGKEILNFNGLRESVIQKIIRSRWVPWWIGLAGIGGTGSLAGVSKPRHERLATRDPQEFRDLLAAWFGEHGKDYPWRRTEDPYAVLVSEVMLQQTRISTVLGGGFFTRFLARFPDLESLAESDDAGLLKAWEGLGYYRRARMLRETARVLVERHGGRFPTDGNELLALPGIGPYTAGAVRAFAFDEPAVLVDGNVIRVLARLMDFPDPVDDAKGRNRIDGWAEDLADPERPRIYHSALMELGQTCCRPRSPDCGVCPVARFCRTRRPEELPVKIRRVTMTAVDEHALWLRDRAGRVLLHREDGSRRTGLWKLPLRDEAECDGRPALAEHRYTITRYRVRLRVFGGPRQRVRPRAGEQWVEAGRIPGLAIAAPFRKVVMRLLSET